MTEPTCPDELNRLIQADAAVRTYLAWHIYKATRRGLTIAAKLMAMPESPFAAKLFALEAICEEPFENFDFEAAGRLQSLSEAVRKRKH